jgi:hypothetical protein
MFLRKRFATEPREFRKALWLGAALMAVTASYTVVKTARDSLFLSTLPATSLPLVYIVVGLVTLATSTGVELLTRPLSPGDDHALRGCRFGHVRARPSYTSLVAYGGILCLRERLRRHRRVAVLGLRQ